MTNAVSRGGADPRLGAGFQSGDRGRAGAPARERIVRRHIRAGVRVLDPNAVYIDPRVTIGRETMLLPGTILRGGDRRRLRLHHRSQCRGAGLRHRR